MYNFVRLCSKASRDASLQLAPNLISQKFSTLSTTQQANLMLKKILKVLMGLKVLKALKAKFLAGAYEGLKYW